MLQIEANFLFFFPSMPAPASMVWVRLQNALVRIQCLRFSDKLSDSAFRYVTMEKSAEVGGSENPHAHGRIFVLPHKVFLEHLETCSSHG